MKRPLIVLSLLAALLLALTACGQETPPADSPSTTGVPDPVETSAAEETATEPIVYDFTGLEPDEFTSSLTGFQGLPWGTLLSRDLAQAAGGQVVTVKAASVSFAGLDFQAEYLFSYSLSIPDLSQEDRALISGQFVRMGYTDLTGQDPGTEMATADFNQTMAYLTQLFGQPNQYLLSYRDAAKGSETLTAPLTPAQMQGDVQSCEAAWPNLEGGTVSLRLNTAYGGMLSVVFAPKP